MAYRVGCEVTGKEWNDCHPSRAEFPAWQWSPRKEVTVAKSAPDDYRSFGPKVNAQGENYYYGARNTLYFDDVFEADAGRAPIYWELGSGSADYHVLVQGPEGQIRTKLDLEAEKLGRIRMVTGSSLGMSVHLTEGIWPIDTTCATQVPGLYAVGDSLGARVGGTRYPNMGIALATCAVSGRRAGINAAEYALQRKGYAVDMNDVLCMKRDLFLPTERQGGFTPGWVTQVLQNTLMPYWMLYVKEGKRLQSGLTQIEFMKERILPKLMASDAHGLRLACETKNMVLSAEMKLRASLFRTESRGTHYREDYPLRDDPNWLAWIKIRDVEGEMKLCKEVIPMKYWPDLNLPYQERYPVRFPRE